MKTSFHAAAGAGGRFVPVKPVLSWASTGQFTITNYDPLLVYVLSNGSATRSGATVTLPSANMSTNVTAWAPKGVVGSTAGYCERKARGTGATYLYGGCVCNPGHGDCRYPGTFHVGGCMDGGGTYYDGFLACGDCYSYYDISYASSGYTDAGSEWYKVA